MELNADALETGPTPMDTAPTSTRGTPGRCDPSGILRASGARLAGERETTWKCWGRSKKFLFHSQKAIVKHSPPTITRANCTPLGPSHRNEARRKAAPRVPGPPRPPVGQLTTLYSPRPVLDLCQQLEFNNNYVAVDFRRRLNAKTEIPYSDIDLRARLDARTHAGAHSHTAKVHGIPQHPRQHQQSHSPFTTKIPFLLQSAKVHQQPSASLMARRMSWSMSSMTGSSRREHRQSPLTTHS